MATKKKATFASPRGRSARLTLHQLQPADAGRKFIVIGSSTWGAHREAQLAWIHAERPNRFLLYEAKDDVSISPDGAILWIPEHGSDAPTYRLLATVDRARQ